MAKGRIVSGRDEKYGRGGAQSPEALEREVALSKFIEAKSDLNKGLEKGDASRWQMFLDAAGALLVLATTNWLRKLVQGHITEKGEVVKKIEAGKWKKPRAKRKKEGEEE
jgi:hypothetical protein